jgi:hypothetical protein
MSVERYELPAALYAGDSLELELELADFPASTWSLTFRGRLEGSPGFDWLAVADGEKHTLTLAPEDTATLAAGDYRVAVQASKAGSVCTLGVVSLAVRPDPSDASADPRSHAKRVLEAIQAVIEKRATKEQDSYSLEGRSLKYLPLSELLRLRGIYPRQVSVEEGRVSAGGARNIRVGLQ